MPRSQPFVDWMKASGLLLIVYGHVAQGSTLGLVPPIYIKQLGVAFFVFATGFTLARDPRPAWQVVVNRLFEVYLFGLAGAVLLSVIWFWNFGGMLPSNYLPLALGANVVFDHFPANPTTWYIGTYMHLLLVWAVLLRGAKIEMRLILAVAFLEVLVRAVLIGAAGPFVAYMLLTNWLSVLLLGMHFGQGQTWGAPIHFRRWQVALVAFMALWATAARGVPWVDLFPYMRLPGLPEGAVLLLVSACATCLYLTVTWLMFRATLGLSANRVVEFVARNTVVVFIVHMPVYFATRPLIEGFVTSYWARVGLRLLVCLVALLVLSEIVHRLVNLRRMRDALVAAIAVRVASGSRARGVLRGA